MRSAWIFPAAFGVGLALTYVFDPRLAVLFAVLFADKVILGAAGFIRRFGIEFTTIATVPLAVLYGPLFSFVFLVVVVPVLHAVKFLSLPVGQPDWPLFVPSPYNIVDALAAVVVGLLSSYGFFAMLMAAVIAKIALYALFDRFVLAKPVDVIGGATYLAFNVIVGLQFGSAFMKMVGL